MKILKDVAGRIRWTAMAHEHRVEATYRGALRHARRTRRKTDAEYRAHASQQLTDMHGRIQRYELGEST